MKYDHLMIERKNICKIFIGESDSPPSWIQRSKTKLEYLQEAVLVEWWVNQGMLILWIYDIP